jgi:outer membrane protein TolC
LRCCCCLGAFPAVAHGESLLELYQRALETNPCSAAAEFGIEQAKAQEDLARSRLLPRVSVSADYNWNDYTETDPSAGATPGSAAR